VASNGYDYQRCGNVQAMTSHLLTERDGAIAHPSCFFHLQQRGSEGLVWDPGQGDVMKAALPALRSLPERSELDCDVPELEAQAVRAQEQAPVIESHAIFGGICSDISAISIMRVSPDFDGLAREIHRTRLARHSAGDCEIKG
jgi:hypothetical protein